MYQCVRKIRVCLEVVVASGCLSFFFQLVSICMQLHSQTTHFENYGSVHYANMATVIHTIIYVYKLKSVYARHVLLVYQYSLTGVHGPHM